MKKRILVILFILLTLVVAGCNNADDSSTAEENNESTDVESSEDGVLQLSDSGPLIDEDNPLNEREEFIHMVEEQKKELKLGFINEDTPAGSVSMFRYTAPELREMETEDVVNYSAEYRSENSKLTIFLDNDPF